MNSSTAPTLRIEYFRVLQSARNAEAIPKNVCTAVFGFSKLRRYLARAVCPLDRFPFHSFLNQLAIPPQDERRHFSARGPLEKTQAAGLMSNVVRVPHVYLGAEQDELKFGENHAIHLIL